MYVQGRGLFVYLGIGLCQASGAVYGESQIVSGKSIRYKTVLRCDNVTKCGSIHCTASISSMLPLGEVFDNDLESPNISLQHLMAVSAEANR